VELCREVADLLAHASMKNAASCDK